MTLTVAVTGPTGEIGKPFIRALERQKDVTRVLGMARRPFDPKAHKWSKTEYRQGDGLRREPEDQPRGIAQRLRGGRQRKGEAAGLRELGRGVRLP